MRLQHEPALDSPFGGDAQRASTQSSLMSAHARPGARTRPTHVVAGPDTLEDFEGGSGSDEAQEVGEWRGGEQVRRACLGAAAAPYGGSAAHCSRAEGNGMRVQDLEDAATAAAAAAEQALKQATAAAESELPAHAGTASGDAGAELRSSAERSASGLGGDSDDSEDIDGQDHSAGARAEAGTGAAGPAAGPDAPGAGVTRARSRHTKAAQSVGWPGAAAMQDYDEDARAPGGSLRPVGVPRVDTQEMRLFPNTPEGHYAEITCAAPAAQAFPCWS